MTRNRESPSRKSRARQAPTVHAVSCSICQALYRPSQQRSDLFQASPLALESAFMSMCHFCFRCRRPSCPDCWDYVHGLCAVCVKEAGLPPRSALPSLDGTLLAPLRQAQSLRLQTSGSPLVCVRTGRYAQDALIERITTRPERPSEMRETYLATPSEASLRPETRAGRTLPDIAEIATRPGHRVSSWSVRVVRIVIWLLMLLLLVALALILLALASTKINAFIFGFCHIDVRITVAVLLQFLRQFFS